MTVTLRGLSTALSGYRQPHKDRIRGAIRWHKGFTRRGHAANGSRRRHYRRGETDGESTPLGDALIDQCSVLRLDELARDGQSESRSTHTVCATLAPAKERLENPLLVT